MAIWREVRRGRAWSEFAQVDNSLNKLTISWVELRERTWLEGNFYSRSATNCDHNELMERVICAYKENIKERKLTAQLHALLKVQALSAFLSIRSLSDPALPAFSPESAIRKKPTSMTNVQNLKKKLPRSTWFESSSALLTAISSSIRGRQHLKRYVWLKPLEFDRPSIKWVACSLPWVAWLHSRKRSIIQG